MKKRSNKIGILFYVLFSASICYGQSANKYIVFVAEVKKSKSFEGIHRTFWIVPQDSVSVNRSEIYPLLLGRYLKNDLNSCCSARPIDPFVSEYYDRNLLDSILDRQIEEIIKLSYRRKKEIFSLKKKWKTGISENITVYAIPVIGEFCRCRYNEIAGIRAGHFNDVYLVKGAASYDDQFWNSDKAVKLKKTDYSSFKFNYSIYYNEVMTWNGK